MSSLESYNHNSEIYPELQEISKELSILKPQIPEFKYIRDSDDYKIYSYTVNFITLPTLIRALVIVNNLNLGHIKWIKITDVKWNEYNETHIFKKWDKIYIKVPKEKSKKKDSECVNNNSESENNNSEPEKKSAEKMKCKWWEYFWIDISEKNESINLTRFKKWNRTKRDSEKQNWRWISFVYIRASDWNKTDQKLTNHLNKIAEYNKDKLIIKNNEKIAVWFYHRLNWLDPEDQAKHFLNLHKNNKNKSGGKSLIPMCDVENWWTTWWMSIRNGETESENKWRIRNHVLTRLKKVETETKIIPWIYINLSNYKKYISWDKRFNKYKKRIAAYDSSIRDSSFVKSWSIDNSGTSPTIYQSRQTWKVDWASNSSWYTDMDRIKDISKILSENNKSK